MFPKLAFWCLVVVIGLCKANLGLNISDCVKDCKTKFLSTHRYLCDATCLQNALEKLVGKVTAKGYNRTLPKPVTPRLVDDAGWRTIQLHFNTTELKTYSDVNYILEVKPDWSYQHRNDSVLVFPYTKKYCHANQTTYFVEDLEPNTGYRFRVIALKQNKSSPFSDWSDVINTTKSCREPPCGPTNILLELMARNRKRCQANENLINSTFRWELDTTASEKNKTDLNDLVYTLTTLNHRSSCGSFSYNEFLGWDNAFHSYDADGKRLYFGCWYEIETKAEGVITDGPLAGLPNGLVGAKRSWIFHVPNYIKTRKGVAVRGCQATTQTLRGGFIQASRTRNTLDQTLTISFNWTTELWKNVNWGYFRVKLRLQRKIISEECIDAFANVDQYNMTLGNLTEGTYDLYILAYDVDHCEEENLLTLSFKAVLPCENSNCNVSKPNSTCEETDLYEGSRCKCDDGFYEDEKLDKCIEANPDPCESRTCGKNRDCFIINATKAECRCKANFREENEQCIPIQEKDAEKSELDKGVIAAAVVTPLLVIFIATCVIFWLWKIHTRRMNFIKREMELAVGFKPVNSYSRSVDVDMRADDNSDRVMNLIYVSQDNAYEIPAYLLEPVNLLELPDGSIRLHRVIGRGEFGKVYAGEAHGINKNSEWTTVAIKTLKESANEEEVSDFLREIELMKDIGKHENVIEMYGCCTRCSPICLVLQYAPGGNLLNYLRSLKKKCKDIAFARLPEVTQSNKEKSRNLFETERDMPEDPAFLIPNENREQNMIENKIEQAQDFNYEIASKINEEVRIALDPKELECFARQIAAGMKHVSDLRVVHRDLAARNILIGTNKVLKISDFGLSREGTYVKNSTGKIPFRWLSIEAMQERTYSTASDVWAFGVVLWEICTLGDVPYSSILDRNLKDFLLAGNRLEKLGSCTDDIYDIMLKCWSHLPKERPTFDELTKKLWDLEHTGSNYVNLERLLQQSMESEDEEKENQDNSKPNDTSSAKQLAGTVSTNKNLDNKGFYHEGNDINANSHSQLA